MRFEMVAIRLEESYFYAGARLERRKIARATLFFLAAYLGSLGGEEVPRIVRAHFIELNIISMSELGAEHTVLPLFEALKGEGNVARCHLMRLSLATKSGFDIGKRIVIVRRFEKDSDNKFFYSDELGKRESANQYAEIFTRTLEEVRSRSPNLIPASINIEEEYEISRSFRKSSTSAAQNASNDECSLADVDRNDRWRAGGRAGMKSATMNMQQLYTDTRQRLRASLSSS